LQKVGGLSTLKQEEKRHYNLQVPKYRRSKEELAKKKQLERFKPKKTPHHRAMICYRCKRPIEPEQESAKTSLRRYHKSCFESMLIDAGDD